MVRGVARLSIAAMATALLGVGQPLVAGAASQPPRGAAHAGNLLARSAPGSLTGLSSPQPGRPGIATALVAGIGANVQVSPVDDHHYSTTAATYDPTNHANLFAASNMVTARPIAGFASTDAGSSWSMMDLPFPYSGPATYEFYPGAAYNADGLLYASYMPYSVSGSTLNSQIAISTSLDKGKSWTLATVLETAATTPEKPLIAVDTTSSQYRNRIYVAYDTNPARGSEPLVVSHSDNGVTWTRTQVADTGGDFGAVPAIGPNGEAYVVWDDWCASNGTACTLPGHILLAKSTDGGMSWLSNGPVATTSIGFQANLPNYSNGCTNPPVNPNPAPSIDVDRSGGVHNGSVYVAWGDQQSGGRMHIFYARSTDGGAHFSTPIQIDSGNNSYGDAWQPALSVDQSNGAVTIAWYDRRDDGGRNLLYRPYYTQSTDGGTSFLTTQVPVANATSDPTLSCLATGDYMQMSAVDGIAHPFWSDTRNGHNQIFTAAVDEASLAQAFLRPAPVFAAPLTFDPNGGGASVAVGDFNGDGKQDLAVVGNTYNYNNTLSIRLGNGDGTFQAKSVYLNQAIPGAVAVGDFNRDGKLDVAVAGEDTIGYGRLWILFGNGDGTFQAPATYTLPGSAASSLVVADFNNDGYLDIATASPSGTGSRVAVFLNKGDGTFGTPTILSAGSQPHAVAAADFNHDGKVDLAVADAGSGNVYIFLGNGDGTFTSPTTYPVGQLPQSIVVGDFNGDGKPDLAVATYSGAAVLIGNGDGTFQSSQIPVGFSWNLSIAAGDFNGDGNLDLAVGNQGSSSASILLGNGNGTFQPPVDYSVGNPAGLAIGDFNNDSRIDLAVVAADVVLLGSRANLSLQPSSLTFTPRPIRTSAVQTVTLTNTGNAALRVAVVGITGGTDFSKGQDSCSGASIAPAQSCTVQVRFTPVGVGSRTARLRFTDDMTTSPQFMPLTGTGLIKWPRPETAPATIPSAPSSVRRSVPPLTPGSPAGPRPKTAPALPSSREGGGVAQPVRLLRLLLL